MLIKKSVVYNILNHGEISRYWLFGCVQWKIAKEKQHLKRKECAMQFLVGFGLSGSEFHVLPFYR